MSSPGVVGVGEAIVPGMVPEVAHRRVAVGAVSGHQRGEVDRPLHEGSSRDRIAADAYAAGATVGGGVAGVEVEGADEVGADGAGGLGGEGRAEEGRWRKVSSTGAAAAAATARSRSKRSRDWPVGPMASGGGAVR